MKKNGFSIFLEELEKQMTNLIFSFTDTVRETEEVSCSEEEPEQSVPQPQPKKVTSNANNNSTAPKKKLSPPAGKKQGSILSFFGKK